MLEWLLFLAITLGGAMVPGANLAIVLRNSLQGSRRDGLLTVLGLSSALLIHGALSLLGITTLIARSPALFDAIRWFGAGYLLLLGLWQLFHRAEQEGEAATGGVRSPYLSGLLVSLFNPKILIFFLAVFVQVLHPEQPLAEQILYVATPALAESAWFTLLLTLLARPQVRCWLMQVKGRLERLVGGALIALGIKLGLG